MLLHLLDDERSLEDFPLIEKLNQRVWDSDRHHFRSALENWWASHAYFFWLLRHFSFFLLPPQWGPRSELLYLCGTGSKSCRDCWAALHIGNKVFPCRDDTTSSTFVKTKSLVISDSLDHWESRYFIECVGKELHRRSLANKLLSICKELLAVFIGPHDGAGELFWILFVGD